MATENRLKVEPDLDFIQDVLENGGESLKKCFQCGTCSVVCNLAPENSPFPRKEMIWAQWGLADKLTTDPNVWTCFQCGDCSAYCPRGANPGDVLGAIRKKVIEGLAWPSFMGKAVADPQYLPFLLGFPALLILFLLLVTGQWDTPDGPVVFGHMISHIQMNVIFPTFSGLAALAFLIGIDRLWKGASGMSLLEFVPKMDRMRMYEAGKQTITDILAHRDFEKCEANNWRRTAHLLVLWGFLGLLLTTALAIVVLVAHEYAHIDAFGVYPLNWYHPVKLLGIVSGAALVGGSWIMIQNRKEGEVSGDLKSSYFDNLFLYVIFGVGITGLLSWILRLTGWGVLAYPTYFVHLVLVFTLLIYSPYSKFAHFVYRTVALIHKRYEELGAEAAEAGEEAEAEAQAA